MTDERGVARLDRTSGTPIHTQLRRELYDAIVGGEFSPGEPLPGEVALARTYAVSRFTVRQALDELQRARLIERRKGSGTYVLDHPPPVWLLQSTEGFFGDPEHRAGPAVRTVILRAGIERLPDWAVATLDLPTGSEGVTLERVRWVGGRLATFSATHCPLVYAPSVLAPGLEHESLYERLARLRLVEVRGGRRLLSAVAADDRIAAHLQLAPGAPVQLVESVSWDAASRPFACHRAWVRTDHLQIEVLFGDGAGDSRALELYVRNPVSAADPRA
jgi:GntR family transcriptional regulator